MRRLVDDLSAGDVLFVARGVTLAATASDGLAIEVLTNSALQIDLSGQVCADSIGHRIYSGIGGQVDFMRGAALSKDGKAILALPSTAARGSLSRIVFCCFGQKALRAYRDALAA